MNEILRQLLEKETSDVNDGRLDPTELKYKRRTKRTVGGQTFDIATPSEKSSRTMKNIPSSGTSIEDRLAAAMTDAGIFFCNPNQLIEPLEGKPDFVLPRFKIAVFCDGDFWHTKESGSKKVKNNSDFWNAKIDRNIARDVEVREILEGLGWKVLRFLGSDIQKNIEDCIRRLNHEISRRQDTKEPRFTFIDLFAGIGGFRVALEKLGGKCLGFAEIDKAATEVYKLNFLGLESTEEAEFGSVTDMGKVPIEDIDLIVGGVPCQSWSVAGKMKGFDDPRGRLWIDTIRLVQKNKPKAFIFENVKGLYDPRNKANLYLILDEFAKLGYAVRYDLLNSCDFGLPQNRERIFIVGIRHDIKNFNEFHFPTPIEPKLTLGDLISGAEFFSRNVKKKIDPKDLFGDKVPMARNRFQMLDELNDFFVFCDTRNGHTTIHSWEITRTTEREKEICLSILRNRRKKKFGKMDGNPLSLAVLAQLVPNLTEGELISLVNKKILRYVEGQGYEFVNSKNSAGIRGIYRIYLPHSSIFSTLTATGTRDMVALKTIAAENPKEYKARFLAEIVKKRLYRPITPKEAGKLQGFPSEFAIHKDEKAAHKQFGNAVSTSVVLHCAKNVLRIVKPMTTGNEEGRAAVV